MTPVDKKRLSLNERLTLYGMARYPSLNDRELARTLGLKISTVTSIKNRLKRAGIFRVLRQPAFHRLGCELISVGILHFNPLLQPADLAKLGRVIGNDFPDVLFCAGDRRRGICISVHRNYTEARETDDSLYRILSEKGYLDNYNLRFHYFPFSQTHLLAYFNFSRILHTLLDIPVQDEVLPPAEFAASTPTPHLTPLEKKIFLALVEQPDRVDSAVAKTLGVSRQTVTKARRHLLDEGLYTPLKKPDLRRLGAEVLGVIYAKFNPARPIQNRKNVREKTLNEIRATFLISGRTDVVGMIPAKNYQELQRQLGVGIQLYRREGLLLGEPEIHILLFDEIYFYKPLTFAPLLRKLIIGDPPGAK